MKTLPVKNIMYPETPKNLDTRTNNCNHSKIMTMCFYHRIMRPKDADEIAV